MVLLAGAVECLQSSWQRAGPGLCTIRSALSSASGALSTAASSMQIRMASNASTSTSQTSTPPTHASQQGSHAVAWNWHWVAGAQRSRKPAIKRPQRHQWYYCNPNYSAAQALPSKILPPHAPPTAALQDEQQLFRQLAHTHRQRDFKKYTQQFQRWVRLRDVDWRNAFQQGMSRDMRAARTHERQVQEQQRQETWKQYKQRVFDQAIEAPAASKGQ